MQWEQPFEAGLVYDEFLERFGKPEHRERWRGVYEQVGLSAAQLKLLGGFLRRMNVLCLTGAWCGDCVNQCPILQRFAEGCDRIDLRFVDRDAQPALRDALAINGGHRVPVVVFLSEDFEECGRFGDRTLSKYRNLAHAKLGAACPTGIGTQDASLLSAVTQEWLDAFERIQWMLRLSPRLREKHRD